MDDERKPGADVWRYSSRRQAIAPAGALFAIWLVHAWPYGLPLVSVGADWRVIVPLALLLLAALVLLPSATADRPMRRKKSKRPSRGNACPSGALHVSPRWKTHVASEQGLSSRRPDSNRGPLHYELWATVCSSHRQSPQAQR
jgi:hypothetical protein